MNRFFLFLLCCLKSHLTAETAAPAKPQAEVKITTKSQYSYFNQKTSELVLRGKAQIERQDLLLEADEILYNESKKEAFATGQVKLQNREFSLESGQLRVYLPGNQMFTEMLQKDVVAIAQKHPVLTEKMDPSGRYTQISAVEIKFFKEEQKIEAMENVHLTQMRSKGNQIEEEMKVTGGYLEYASLLKKALVKHGVRLQSKEIGGEGERLIYYQNEAKFYLIDQAKLYQFDTDGKAKDTVKGNKILHLMKEKRTILIGNVEGSITNRE